MDAGSNGLKTDSCGEPGTADCQVEFHCCATLRDADAGTLAALADVARLRPLADVFNVHIWSSSSRYREFGQAAH